jgi:hypothetical protein
LTSKSKDMERERERECVCVCAFSSFLLCGAFLQQPLESYTCLEMQSQQMAKSILEPQLCGMDGARQGVEVRPRGCLYGKSGE